MDCSKIKEINGIDHVGDVPSAKKGIIDFLSGEDRFKDSVPKETLNSYKKGREIAVEIENMLNGDQRAY
ncbi:hypothetical protein [Clostridium estertheticum]|uniref:Uncharacterized protein n=1 Tax=Clostridium estertheticum TaxID=238834 RepID=A0A5N7IJ48_9CLOT|nr:hypothetical protein [Clostridium estertheticum]MBU3179225.1 hypothetical protein [Clostridium estertheticum]MBU3215270.1 hypothetical protein [Clostridium estertheticum]MBW9172179.1 hypothetical protein [Clostridium estertheticum]MBX4264912.1 hypothetical protein [Clostridium estertheticum]MCB2308157.1 hypothetical protein [Clostridium estertheticum]